MLPESFLKYKEENTYCDVRSYQWNKGQHDKIIILETRKCQLILHMFAVKKKSEYFIM